MKYPLHKLFSTYVKHHQKPFINYHTHYSFYCNDEHHWFTVAKNEVSDRDYTWLTLFYKEVATKAYTTEEQWQQFLYTNGEIPATYQGQRVRMIQLHLPQNDELTENITEAISHFFDMSALLLPISSEDIVIVEQQSATQNNKEDFIALIRTIEADFFINIHLYKGNFYEVNETMQASFQREVTWFTECRRHNSRLQFYSFETVLPILMMKQMPRSIAEFIEQQILQPLEKEQELLQTMKVFYECGLNNSVASKKLHIHRNTLNYRLQKFEDITSISSKSLDGALVVYFASYLQSYSKLHKNTD